MRHRKLGALVVTVSLLAVPAARGAETAVFACKAGAPMVRENACRVW